jgi:hypothetical protein
MLWPFQDSCGQIQHPEKKGGKKEPWAHSTTNVVVLPAESKLEGVTQGVLRLSKFATWSTECDGNSFLLIRYPER